MRSNSLDKELKMKQMELMIKMKEKSDSEEVSTLDPLLQYILMSMAHIVAGNNICRVLWHILSLIVTGDNICHNSCVCLRGWGWGVGGDNKVFVKRKILSIETIL